MFGRRRGAGRGKEPAASATGEEGIEPGGARGAGGARRGPDDESAGSAKIPG
jgi:hypothetical protein